MGLVLLLLAGGILMISYTNFLILFLGIEIVSIAAYILAGSAQDNIRSNEASIKYLLLGSFASAVFLFGVALFYIGTGTFGLTDLMDEKISPLYTYVGSLFILIGLAFKLALAPMHMWAPDVYEGSPGHVTAMMATVIKIAAAGALLRFFQLIWGIEHMPHWFYYICLALIIASLFIGNLMALIQRSVKRMLAYSSVVHAGFIFLAILFSQSDRAYYVSYYLVTYAVASLICFILVDHLEKRMDGLSSYDNFDGLVYRDPLAAVAMTVALISLAGIPLTGGFLAKFFVLFETYQNGQNWIVIFALIMAAVSMYYYFKLIGRMFFRKNDGTESSGLSAGLRAVVLILMLAVLFSGILPSQFMYFFGA